MAMYRKKPIVVEAWQWSPPAWGDMPQWLLDAINAGTCCCHQSAGDASDMVVTINTLEGMMTAQPGDWIIQGVKGEIYPCKPNVFAATYDPAETERLLDVEVAALQPCGYCEKHVARPCRTLRIARMCDELKQPPDVEAMPPGARADAMRPPDVVMQPIGAAPEIHEDDYHHPNQRATRFRDEIEQVINSHSRENGSDTPDFILAQFVLDVMDAFDRAVTRRSGWYKPPGPIYDRIAELEAQLNAEGEHTAAGQAEIERLIGVCSTLDEVFHRDHQTIEDLKAENVKLRGELQRVSMAGMTPSMVVGK